MLPHFTFGLQKNLFELCFMSLDVTVHISIVMDYHLTGHYRAKPGLSLPAAIRQAHQCWFFNVFAERVCHYT